MRARIATFELVPPASASLTASDEGESELPNNSECRTVRGVNPRDDATQPEHAEPVLYECTCRLRGEPLAPVGTSDIEGDVGVAVNDVPGLVSQRIKAAPADIGVGGLEDGRRQSERFRREPCVAETSFELSEGMHGLRATVDRVGLDLTIGLEIARFVIAKKESGGFESNHGSTTDGPPEERQSSAATPRSGFGSCNDPFGGPEPSLYL